MLASGQIVARTKNGIVAYDPARHTTTVLMPADDEDLLDLTADRRTLQLERKVVDSDLWSVTLSETGQ